MRLPDPLRRPIAKVSAVILEPLAGSRITSQLAPFTFIAHWAAGQPEAANDFARRFGCRPDSPIRSRRRLALLSAEVGLTGTATAIVDSIVGDPSPSLAVLRARFALDRGRYTEALAAADVALRAGVRGTKWIADRVEGEVAILDPDWLPDLGSAGDRLVEHRGHGTRGRILHFVGTSQPYYQAGYTVRTQSVVRAQIEAGIDARVVTRAGFPRSEGILDAPAEEVVDGVPYYRVLPDQLLTGRPDSRLIESVRAAAPLLETLRPAALQPASDYTQAKTALALARPLGIPVVYEVRGFWEMSWAAVGRQDEDEAVRSEQYQIIRAAETAAMIAADAVITLSATMRAEIIDRGCPADRIVVVPNAVELDRFHPAPRDVGLAASLGIGPDEPVVGYVSTFNAYEGIPLLIEAAATLRGLGRRVRVLLVGDGPFLSEIQATVRRFGLDDGTVILPGRVSHERVDAFYSLFDVFVVPRLANRVSRLVTPLKPFEAMALERAVVASNLPALLEIVEDGETGMTFEAGDAGDLARVLGQLLDDPALRVRLGRQAREWIVRERTWASNGRRYRALYERLGVV